MGEMEPFKKRMVLTRVGKTWSNSTN